MAIQAYMCNRQTDTHTHGKVLHTLNKSTYYSNMKYNTITQIKYESLNGNKDELLEPLKTIQRN